MWQGLLVALWYSNVEDFAFHCFARLLADIIDSTFYLTVFMSAFCMLFIIK